MHHILYRASRFVFSRLLAYWFHVPVLAGQAMWNKAEENAEALQEAFDVAAERSAQEAEHAMVEALTKAENAFRGKTGVMSARERIIKIGLFFFVE